MIHLDKEKSRMLKLTYTEAGLSLERVTVPLEAIVAQRVILALRTGQPLHIEPGHAAFLILGDAPGLAHLKMTLRQETCQCVTVTAVDDEFVEVRVHGSWLAQGVDAHEGVFLTALSERAEFFLYKVWQATHLQVSSLA
jgi:hypothetical protein